MSAANDCVAISKCRVCGASNVQPFFDVGMQPLANSLLVRFDALEKSYPLTLMYCNTCGLVQLTHTVSSEILFTEYVWVTGTSSTARAYAEIFCKRFLSRGDSKRYVLELASNDGTFLKPFMARGKEVLGVDPAENIVSMANADGVPTVAEFWTAEYAKRLRKEKGPAGFVFARNVVPHVADARDFIDGCAVVLSEDGVLAIEVHDARTIHKELHYDSIYHEHMCYFTFATVGRLLAESGLFVFDLETSPISGGSMVVYARHGKQKESSAVRARRSQEESEGINTLASWQEFADRAIQHKDAFVALLREARARGERLIGYGASARSSTLLNFCRIGPDVLPVIIDKNPLKQGKYTAGVHIPIEIPERGMAQKPDVVVILAWNFTDEIQAYLASVFDFHGPYIVPLPGKPRRIT